MKKVLLLSGVLLLLSSSARADIETRLITIEKDIKTIKETLKKHDSRREERREKRAERKEKRKEWRKEDGGHKRGNRGSGGGHRWKEMMREKKEGSAEEGIAKVK
jgi:hypothetical protein